MGTGVARRTVLKGAAAAGALAFAPPLQLAARAAAPNLTAGAASRDITPENGGEFFGYVRPDMRADGVSIRLQAHALVLDDGERKIALVAVDLGSVTVKSQVVERVRHLGLNAETVLIAATHTHAGPFETPAWITDQIAQAIIAADRGRVPARAGWGMTELRDANVNRAVEAHLANHGMDLIPGIGEPELDPEGPDHTRDTVLRLLRVEALDGRPIAAWTHFAAHPTTYIPSNTSFSADFCGVATRRFARVFRGARPVAMFTNGTEGDLITWFDDYNQHALADRIGLRVAAAMGRAWHAAAGRLGRRLVVDARSTTATFAGQEVEPGRRVAAYVGFWGASFFGGARNGPSPFYEVPGMEGRRRPAALADPVHGRKIIASPAPWFPNLELQALRVGDRMLLGLPGEPTVEMGRRVVAAATPVRPAGVSDTMIVGLANGMHGYFTTPEEYDQQHYEGGHTVFGKWSSLLLEQTHVRLAGDLAARHGERVAPAGGEPSPAAPPTGDGGSNGQLVLAPPPAVTRMWPVRVAWKGGLLGRDRPVDEPFVVLEREVGGAWVHVDDDLEGWAFVWRELLGSYEARYDLAPGHPIGRHRLRIRSARYELVTPAFEVQVATTLRVRGVQRERDGLLVLAQNPPPDPGRNLRTRAVSPSGGSVRLRIGDRVRRGTWDERRGGWVVRGADAPDGAPVTVPDRGLVDEFGNHSGSAATLRVGEVAPVSWPPNIGPAGGRSPGPLGIGTFPP